jgi:tyrosyl-tRNA synthetase
VPTIVDLLLEAGLVQSKGEARRAVAEGGAYLNNVRVASEDATLGTADLLAGEWAVLRRGKRSLAAVRVRSA